ncbi:MAG: hypothetical protein PHE84_06035 [bacterium]|nr:hypothetical protein [bacterium]
MNRSRMYSMVIDGRRNTGPAGIRHPVFNSLPFALCALLLFSGCSSVIQSSSRPPQAIAVSSYAEAEAGTVIILDGGNSYDPEGNPVGCLWQESVENPEINLIPDEVQKKFAPENCLINIIPNQDGEYLFQLKVSDMVPGHKESQADLVSLLITPPPPPPNPPPVAIAKADRTRAQTDETVVLTGEESFDQAGGSLTYFWAEDYQNPVTGLVSPGSVTQVVLFSQPGGYRFELTVSNGLAWSRPNSVRINVDSRVDRVPTADAGEDRNTSYYEEVRLSGARSSDPDGDRISYRWTQTAGPPVVLFPSSYAEEITFTVPDEILTYSFSLMVDDGRLASAPDTVSVRVWEHSTNNVPDAVWVDRFYPYLDSNGSRVKPYRKIQDGINALAAYPGSISDVYIAEGSYYEKITAASGISIYGGFDPGRGWEHDPSAWSTYLNAVQTTALEIPQSVTATVYVDGLKINGLPKTSSYSWGVDCRSDNLILKRNTIDGGGGEGCFLGVLRCGSTGVVITSSSPHIINNVIFGGDSSYLNTGIGIWNPDNFQYGLNAKPGTEPLIAHNYVNGGGKSDETSPGSYGISIGTNARAIIINNIIDPGLGSVEPGPNNPFGENNRFGIWECSGPGGNNVTACLPSANMCSDNECNPALFNNSIIKNNPQAILFYDGNGELKDQLGSIISLYSISQVNQLGNTKALDYSKNNLDLDPIFVGKESGDYHLSAYFDYPGGPTEPAETSPLLDAGVDAGVRFDFDLQPRPNCLITGATSCFDIGPDEVYLNY